MLIGVVFSTLSCSEDSIVCRGFGLISDTELNGDIQLVSIMFGCVYGEEYRQVVENLIILLYS